MSSIGFPVLRRGPPAPGRSWSMPATRQSNGLASTVTITRKWLNGSGRTGGGFEAELVRTAAKSTACFACSSGLRLALHADLRPDRDARALGSSPIERQLLRD